AENKTREKNAERGEVVDKIESFAIRAAMDQPLRVTYQFTATQEQVNGILAQLGSSVRRRAGATERFLAQSDRDSPLPPQSVAGLAGGFYFWSGDAEPARRAGELFRPAYEILKRKFFIDEIYQWTIDRVVLAAGGVIAWFDRNVVNDTGVDGSAGLGVFAGFGMKFLETGKLPNYALAIVTGVIVLAIVFMAVQV
ncbi:hypothetical protein LCGC14_2908180, partial [marine sediment metagenome]